jgi:hypothetical protein
MTRSIDEFKTMIETIYPHRYDDRRADYELLCRELKAASETGNYDDEGHRQIKEWLDDLEQRMKPKLGVPGGSTTS